MDEELGAGLRERKKVRTREAIIDAATELFARKGFDATTVEEIAAAADVSPRTFFRYFPTKEDVVFLDQDLENTAIVEAFRTRRHDEDDVDVLLRATNDALTVTKSNRSRMVALYQIIVSTPLLQAKAFQITLEAEQLIVEGLVGKRPSRAELLRARVVAAAVIAAERAAMVSWIEGGARGDPLEVVREVGVILRQGFGRKR